MIRRAKDLCPEGGMVQPCIVIGSTVFKTSAEPAANGRPLVRKPPEPDNVVLKIHSAFALIIRMKTALAGHDGKPEARITTGCVSAC
jgi:hypothetical protein